MRCISLGSDHRVGLTSQIACGILSVSAKVASRGPRGTVGAQGTRAGPGDISPLVVMTYIYFNYFEKITGIGGDTP